MKREINYSIIIPHKNIPRLLQRCLSSIPRRKDVQIIVVDDNSAPDKVDFKQFPGQDDFFVEVIFTKEGKGAGYARNIGLTKAIGKWLLFADADDFFNYCINDILDEYINSDADIVYFKHNSLDSNTYAPTCRLFDYNIYINQWISSSIKNDNLLRYKHATPWSKLFSRKSIVKNQILFDEVSRNNDVTFSYLAGFYARAICVDIRTLYCCTVRQGSIQHKKPNIENKLDALFVFGKNYRFSRAQGIFAFRKSHFFRSLAEFLLFDRIHSNKAKNVLARLGFSQTEIKRLCFFALWSYVPFKIIRKLTFYFKINASK